MKMRIFGRNINKPGVSLEGNDWFLDKIRACIGYHQLLDFKNNFKRRKKYQYFIIELLKIITKLKF